MASSDGKCKKGRASLEKWALAHGGEALVRITHGALDRSLEENRFELHKDFERNLQWYYEHHRRDEGAPHCEAHHAGHKCTPGLDFMLRCFVCWKKIQISEQCHACPVCIPYRECEACYTRKAGAHIAHPHFAAADAAAHAAHAAPAEGKAGHVVGHVVSAPVVAAAVGTRLSTAAPAMRLSSVRPHAAAAGACAVTYSTLFPPADARHRNILAFDGGGIRGYLSILVFERWCRGLYREAHKGGPELGHSAADVARLDDFVRRVCREKFSLITGTSIGGILALMLGLETKLSVIKTLFETRADEIFHKNPFFKPGSSKYTVRGLQDICTEVIRQYAATLPESDPLRHDPKPEEKLRVVDMPLTVAVTTYDLAQNEVRYFPIESREVTVLDAALSTSAAPTYFPCHRFRLGERDVACIDGGMWGNDPRLVGLLYEELATAFRYNPRSGQSLLFSEDSAEGGGAEGGGAEGGDSKHEEKAPAKSVGSDSEDWDSEDGEGAAGPEEGARNVYHVVSIGTGKTLKYRGARHWLFSNDSSLAWVLGSPNVLDVLLDASSSMVDRIFPYLSLTGSVLCARLQVILKEDIELDDTKSLDRQRKAVDAMPESDFQAAVELGYIMGTVDNK